MDEGADHKMADALATATAQKETEEEDEMPLLFMDGLPSDFQRNAQLAAIATFMASDDEAAEASADDAEDVENAHGAAQKKQRKAKRKTRRAQQKPYAKTKARAKDETKELQLFLSMFHVSKD
ncbi:hypothetical protein Poli38472_003499 [Pythium oligandrum]|uniref:Uncharacterized protein n=1 Tax=Pythium oligandrum TaxID=41045 RepID=A0A8K1C6X7_PYTOL|nr:hypothetical protein Poli38472_003499 [Pythium oligandrum]|eukprot:TMW57574.1 hypothetical protein Poli38472_003499 [Pythium oligandrum]